MEAGREKKGRPFYALFFHSKKRELEAAKKRYREKKKKGLNCGVQRQRGGLLLILTFWLQRIEKKRLCDI